MKRSLDSSGSSFDPEPRPPYLRIKAFIADRIRSGEWAPKFRLPSENEMVRDFGVSRMTVNRAFRELTAEGLIVRTQGLGSFVADIKPSSELLEVRNIADEITSRGHTHAAKILVAESRSADPDMATALGLKPGAPVFHTVIVHHENDVPVQLEDRFVSPACAPGYLDHDFSAVTPNAVLSRLAPLTEIEHVVEAILPETWEAKALDMAETEPCLLMRRRTWSAGMAVSIARLVYPGKRFRLIGRNKISG